MSEPTPAAPPRIIIAGNGPSAQSRLVRAWADLDALVVRTNYFFLAQRDVLKFRCDVWFICEHDPADLRAVRAYFAGLDRAGLPHPLLVIPGLDLARHEPMLRRHLEGECLEVQRFCPNLPPGCRWDVDQAPERPLMGSYALAWAVPRQPAELYLCGHDLFRHPAGNHGGVDGNTRPWQDDFVREYLENRHRNHTFRGDLKYIRSALTEYRSNGIVCGSVLKNWFQADFPSWTWLEG